MADTDAPPANHDLLMGAWIFAMPAIGGFLLALGLMLVPPSLDNDGGSQQPTTCGVPALFDRESFAEGESASGATLAGQPHTSECAERVAVREHQAVGALTVATPLGLLALTLHLHRRTARARQ